MQDTTSTLRQKPGFYSGRWPRFTRYEVRDGLICPVSVEEDPFYDPWEGFDAPHGKQSTRQPYHSLLDLVAWLDSTDISETLEKKEERILKWCADWGLLGLLPEQALEITLSREQVRLSPHDHPEGEFFAFRKQPGEWRMWRINRFRGAQILLRRLDDFEHRTENPSKTLPQFFPRAQRGGPLYPIPVPLSDDFWIEYGEPLSEFISAARLFRETVAAYERAANPEWRAAMTQNERDGLVRAEGVMSRLTSSVAPLLYAKEDAVSGHGLGYVADSLLAHFAMMASLDLARSRQLVCPVCGKHFLSLAREAKYCSSKCRKTQQMRKYRSTLSNQQEEGKGGTQEHGKKKTRSKRR